ncbi:SDR family NAD(P)-dependent oxidoreductase [Pseudonocardia ailaonensis]|uniref:SDR family NAD(P)-dependent oxidoreductase n=1 Tax=Pseudonocardia ailaonensis TaxID=367279 RepID=A0ABN2N3T4_9PSEU
MTTIVAGSRSAVVTGAGRGIGRAIARELAGRGYRVLVTDVDGAAAEATAATIPGAKGLAYDVTDPEAAHAVAAAARELAPLGAWVANAGVGDDGTVSALEDAQVRKLVEINLLGVLWGVRAATAAFRAQRTDGEIGLVASLSGLGPVPGLSVYAATKAAVLSLGMSLHSELRADGIRVHTVNPDGADTALLSGMAADGQGRALVRSGVLLTPEQVARALVGMFGTSRVVRTVPGWRGAMVRLSTLAPSHLMKAEPLLRRVGAARIRKEPTR